MISLYFVQSVSHFKMSFQLESINVKKSEIRAHFNAFRPSADLKYMLI